MELFKLFGKIAISNDEANAALEETADKADSLGKTVTRAVDEIKPKVDKAFETSSLDDFSDSLNDVSNDANKVVKDTKGLSKGLDDVEDAFEDAEDAVDDYDDSVKGAGDTTEKTEDKISKSLAKIGAAVAAAFAIDKIMDFGKEIVSVAGEVSAEVSAFNQIMGDYSEEASKKVDKIADATGMVSTRLTPYMTSMTAKFKGLGYDIDSATNLASDGLNLAADAAAFWDKSLDDSMSHLNSFINGSYEGGEAIGLFANDTQMAAYAVESGVVKTTKAWSSLDEATKQATRLEYAKKMYEQSGATGQAAKEADQYANVQANLTEKWRQFKAQIGEPVLQNIVLPAMEKLSGWVDIASDKFQSLQKWVSENKTGLQIAAGVAVGLGTAISILAVAMNAAAIKAAILATATKIATAAQEVFNFVMNANPIGIIITLIAALVAAFIYLWNNCEGFREFWINLWDKIKEAAGKVADWFKKAWGAVVDWFSDAWQTVKDVALAVWDAIKAVWEFVKLWFRITVIDPVVILFTGLWTVLKGIWDGIVAVVKFAINLIAAIIDAAIQLITLPFRFIWENCKEYVFAAWNWIVEKVTNGINKAKQIITTVWTAVSKFFSTIWNGIKNIVGKAWDWIKTKVTTQINIVKSVITTVFNAVKSFITTVWNGIKNIVGKAWDWIKNKVTTAINAVKTVITTVFTAVKTVVSNVWNGIKTVISNVWNGIKTTVTNAVNNVKSKVSSVFNAIKTTVTNVWNGIKNAIKTPIEKARDLVKTAIDKIKGFFNFEFKWPKLKMPHFGINPKGWKIGDLLKGEIPKLSIDWYAKAMNNPIIMTRPTLFGLNGNGELMAGGEAGSEVVSGANTLMSMIRANVKNEIGGAEQKLETLISMLAEFMPEIIDKSQKQIVLNNGVLVGELAPAMDLKLGEIDRLRGRGR